MFGEPLSLYFGAGARLVYMRHAQKNLPIHGQGFTKNVIELFLQDVNRFPMPVTRTACQSLREFLKKIQNRKVGDVLNKEEADELTKIASNITTTFESESENIQTIVLVEKRFDMSKLMSGVRSLLSSGVFESLPIVAQTDMNEAGKCIALSRSTASAFHCLRATEAMLKKLYLHIVKRGRLKRPMWADMVDALRKRTVHRPPNELLDLLDGIRQNYRNPTQHPDKVYDIDEAQDLFGQCIAAQNLMLKAILGI